VLAFNDIDQSFEALRSVDSEDKQQRFAELFMLRGAIQERMKVMYLARESYQSALQLYTQYGIEDHHEQIDVLHESINAVNRKIAEITQLKIDFQRQLRSVVELMNQQKFRLAFCTLKSIPFGTIQAVLSTNEKLAFLSNCARAAWEIGSTAFALKAVNNFLQLDPTNQTYIGLRSAIVGQIFDEAFKARHFNGLLEVSSEQRPCRN
jgi:tetratricopeptide (TPR) repeat protein